MSTGVKAQRPVRLSEEETLTSFEDWKNNLLFYLNQEKSFAPFLIQDAGWKKSSDADVNRGVQATELPSLKNFLGVIAGLAPPLLHGDIIDDSTKLEDIFNFIRGYYNFAPSEATFLKFCAIKREIVGGNVERPVRLYLRLRQFIRDNLLLSGGKITHDGALPTASEKMSPTTERLIVLRWLELLHPKLPDHVGKVFSADLRSKSLKDLQPLILEQVDDLLSQIDQQQDGNNASLLNSNLSFKRFGNFQKRKKKWGGSQGYSKSDSESQNFNSHFQQRRKIARAEVKKCDACKAVDEPFIGHTIQNCRNIHPKDRQNILQTFALNVTEVTEEEDEDEMLDDEFEEDEQVNFVEIDKSQALENSSQDQNEICTSRVSIKQSPRINVKIKNTYASALVDTGATGDMIRMDFCLEIGLPIQPTPHSASQADASKLNVVGEVHTTLTTENNNKFELHAIVVRDLKASLIISEAFLEKNEIIVDIPRRRLLLPTEKTIPFADQPGNPKISLLRAEVNCVMFPGDTITIPTPKNFKDDMEVAIEPRIESVLSYEPMIVENSGELQLQNESDFSINIKRGQIIGQLRSVNEDGITMNNCDISPPVKQIELKSEPEINKISIDPQSIISKGEREEFKAMNKKYSKVFGPNRGSYNSKSGEIIPEVHIGKAAPAPKKGKVPSYNRKNMEVLQEKFDELHREGVLVRAEDYGIQVKHSSPSFLVKKSDDKSHRLVTSFTELNKFIRPLPTKMSTTADVLRSVSRWKYIIKTDLKSAYYQMKMKTESMEWLGTNSPYKGMYVYARGAMGLRNMAEYLEEMVSRVFGDMIAEGIVDKVADDLQAGGNTVKELLENWERVLQRLEENGLTISASKTIICPKTVKILGWIWENGTIRVDTHRTNPLTVCSMPDTVKQLRSFIGAFRAVSVCIPNYGRYLCRLEDMVAGKESRDKLVWNNELINIFKEAQGALANPKTITLPHPNDQLILISDGCNSLPAVGATLFVKRDKLRVAGYFSAKIGKFQIPWLPCETEALGINLAITSFSHVIRESKHTTKFLTDSKPCVQAFEKLSKGGFSLSPRISSFLMNLNAHNIAIEHVKGSTIMMTDFSSRNPIVCPDQNCQVCKFVNDQVELAVTTVTISEIESGEAKMPFYNISAWKQAQKSDPDLKRCFAQITEGTRPGKKEKNVRVLRRYFQIATISESGLLIHRKANPYGRDFELIIVPKELAGGLISALHLQLGHPTKTQFKKIWDRYFFALDSERLIENCTTGCPLCTSMLQIPKELFSQSTREVPETVGSVFSADVIRREGQKILVLQDVFSSFLVAQMISNEQSLTLQQSMVHLSANYKHPSGCVIRVDTATGFQALKKDKFLQSIGIELDFGRIKNKNKNPSIDKAIQELEKEIKRLSPDAGAISAGLLAVAVCNTNSRVRKCGLSAKEILTKREHYSGNPLNFSDEEISSNRYESRIKNHRSSEKSKASGALPAKEAEVVIGDIVHVKNEGTKHKAREFYLVVAVDHEQSSANIQKFCGNTLRQRQYTVKLNEIYRAAANFGSSQQNEAEDEVQDDEVDGIELNNGEPAQDAGQGTLRRSGRERHQPDWLATDEIQRCSDQ